MLQTGLGWVRALGWFCVVSPARRPHNQLLKLRSDMLCTFQIISVLEDELLRNVEVPQFDVLKLFFSHVGQSMIKHLILFVYYALVSS